MSTGDKGLGEIAVLDLQGYSAEVTGGDIDRRRDIALDNALAKLHDVVREIDKILKFKGDSDCGDIVNLHDLNWGRACGRLYSNRRIRDGVFSKSNIFSDPAWDILLDLMVSEYSGRKVAVTDACIASCSPSTTALRWITVLESRGLVARCPDALDGRRVYVQLTKYAKKCMQTYLLKAGLV